MDTDDITVQTKNSGNASTFVPTPSISSFTEYVVKFVFRPETIDAQKDVATTHFQILSCMKELCPDTVIYNNAGKSMKKFTLTSTASYLRHYKLIHKKGNEKKRRGTMYQVFHRILTDVPISEIRRNDEFKRLLGSLDARMNVHVWAEDETDIVNLGFHIGVDPGNYRKEHFQRHVAEQISIATKTNIKNIPRFQCGFTSPFIYDEYNAHSVTKTYDIQCQQIHAKTLIRLLERTYTNNPSFMFHKVRHTHPHLYRDAIRSQNNYLSSIRIVPLHGVPSNVMFYLEQNIMPIPGVKSILHHRLTESHGRWSIVVETNRFDSVKNALRADLATWTHSICEDRALNLPPDYPSPQLAFKNEITDEVDSHGGYDSYITACSSIYSVRTDKGYDDPPTVSLPVSQACKVNIPSVITTPSSLHPSSSTPTDDQEQLKIENIQLRKQVQTLTDQVCKLTARLDEVLVAIRSPTAANTSIQPGQPTATDVNMSVDASFNSEFDASV
jgi:hypothetical protein